MTEESRKNSFIKQNTWIIPALIHFGLSFVYERLIIKFDPSGWDIFWSQTKNEVMTNQQQSVMLYIYGKMIAAMLICLLWYVIFRFVKKVIPKHIMIMAGIIMVVLGTYFYLFWPSSSEWKDTFTLYGFAIRLIPWYWHNFLTSAWFLGCLMVLPHPLIIAAVQFVGFSATILYLYYRIEKTFKQPMWKNLLILLVYIAPETFWLIAFPYRNCIYAIILMFYIAFLIMEDIDREQGSNFKYILLCFLSALLSVWRTEGILVGVAGMALVLFKVYKPKLLKKVIYLAVFATFFLILNFPQKIGTKQYYGKDYLFASTVEPVKCILNDKDANMSYTGAEDDLAAINAFVPLEYIKYDGKNSVNAYFYQQGNIDFDQTLVPDDIQSGYFKGVVRLALHNIPTYLKCQLNLTFGCLNMPWNFEMDEYEGEPIDIEYVYEVDAAGDLDYHRFANPLVNNAFHAKAGSLAAVVTVGYRQFIEDFGITSVVRVLILLLDIVIFVMELVHLFRKKKVNVVFLAISLLFLAQFAIVVMTIPMVLDMYFYSIFYPCLVMECIYVYGQMAKINKNAKNEKNNKA